LKCLRSWIGRYLYLPRLQTGTVLLNSIRAARALLTWEQDAFAYAESYDESAARYRGLHSGAQVNVIGADTGLLVKPEIAQWQIDQETYRVLSASTWPRNGKSPEFGKNSDIRSVPSYARAALADPECFRRRRSSGDGVSRLS
jgi:hypothetical protein